MQRAIQITKLLLATLFLTTLLALIIRLFTTPFSELFTHTGLTAQLLFLAMIITEIVIAPIPGGFITLFGAAHFGWIPAWIILYIGSVIGVNIAFLLAKKYGRPFVKKLIPDKQRKPYEKLMKKHPRLLWLCYAIPILPIGILSILLGLTATKHKTFFTITSTGLITYTCIWTYIGAHYLIHVPHFELIATTTMLALLAALTWWLYKEFSHHLQKN